MNYHAASLICSQWSATVKATLIVLVALVLLAVVTLLVFEIIGKREQAGAPQESSEYKMKNAEFAPAEEPAPEPDDDELDIGVTLEDEQEEDSEEETEDELEVNSNAIFIDADDESGTMILGDVQINVLYNRSFTAMLTQADDSLKGFYSDLKNELLSYGLKSRMSWSNESWYISRITYAKFGIRGKTLSLYLGLNPVEFDGTKYSCRDVSKTAKYRDVPMQLKIKSARAVQWAKELIAAIAAKKNFTKTPVEPQNFRPDYKNTKTLVEENLIKIRYRASGESSRQELESAAALDIKLKDRAPRDFTTRLMRADSETKEWYSAIKNELLRYGMKSRMSTSCESWYIGRTTHAKFAIRGKTLSLYMALDPAEFEGTKYNYRNASDVSRFEKVPLRVKLKSARAVRWSKELLAAMAEKNGWQRSERTEEDFRYVSKKKKR